MNTENSANQNGRLIVAPTMYFCILCVGADAYICPKFVANCGTPRTAFPTIYLSVKIKYAP